MNQTSLGASFYYELCIYGRANEEEKKVFKLACNDEFYYFLSLVGYGYQGLIPYYVETMLRNRIKTVLGEEIKIDTEAITIDADILTAFNRLKNIATVETGTRGKKNKYKGNRAQPTQNLVDGGKTQTRANLTVSIEDTFLCMYSYFSQKTKKTIMQLVMYICCYQTIPSRFGSILPGGVQITNDPFHLYDLTQCAQEILSVIPLGMRATFAPKEGNQELIAFAPFMLACSICISSGLLSDDIFLVILLMTGAITPDVI